MKKVLAASFGQCYTVGSTLEAVGQIMSFSRRNSAVDLKHIVARYNPRHMKFKPLGAPPKEKRNSKV